MLIFDLVFTFPSTKALLWAFWKNIDDNPPPFQMAENSNILIDSQECGHSNSGEFKRQTAKEIAI